jgi:hypothetical protein
MMNRKLACVIASIPLMALLAGCASETIRTRKLSPTGTAGTVAGIPYYLPRLAVRITITGTKPTPKPGEAPDPKDKYKFTVSMTPEYVADANSAYFLEYDEDVFSDDAFKIKVGANGLLQSADSKSQDRSGDVIRKFAELAAQAAKGFALHGTGVSLPQPPRAGCTLPDFTAEKIVLVDFESSRTAQPITIDVGGNEIKLGQISIQDDKPLPVEPNRASTKKPVDAQVELAGSQQMQALYTPPAATIQSTDHDGVIFPVARPTTLAAKFGPSPIAIDCNAAIKEQALYAMAPTNDIFRLEVNRAAFVTKHMVLYVTDGILTGIDVDKPSEALGFINIPVEVLKTLVAIPGELLTIKLKQMQDEGALSKAEAESLKQQLEVIKAQQALDQARAAGTH